MKTKNKIKKPAIVPARDREEAERLTAFVTSHVARQTYVQARLAEQLLEVHARFATDLGLLTTQIREATEQVRLWAVANPTEFSDKKSIEFGTGIIGFRTDPPSLGLLSEWTWKKALKAVQELIPTYIRNKPEIDKEAILASREESLMQNAIKGCGMKFVQEEKFFIDPNLDTVPTRQVVPAEKGAQ